jgi:hypothetical protein
MFKLIKSSAARALGMGPVGSAGRITRSRLVQWVAGTAIGLAPRRGRRGSVLVLVVGALALISVIAIVYVTLGRADRDTSAQVVRRENVDETMDRISAYLMGIIGDNALAVAVDAPPPVGSRPSAAKLVRQDVDYPATCWFVYSAPYTTPNNPDTVWDKFNPVGSYDRAGPSGVFDGRYPSDPWLASTEPVWMHYTPGAGGDYLNALDWPHISNFAPDGRFVNLYNLRKNFDARSGTGPDPLIPLTNRMSEGLSLLDRNGRGSNLLAFGGQANLNTPAHWDSSQRGAYRVMRASPLPGQPGPANSDYIFYQWADADGDGMADSRWIELTDSSGGPTDSPISLLPRDGRYRWFIAARAIDLSGLVNVNTATDFRTGPQAASPTQPVVYAGSSPADIDLRRLLMLDPNDHYTLAGYHDIDQPRIGSPLAGGPTDYTNYAAPQALDAGRWGYAALRRALDTGLVPAVNGLGTRNERPAAIYPRAFDNVRLLDAPARLAYYQEQGGQGGEGSYSNAGGGRLFYAGSFGVADQLELFTYRMVNDPWSTSRLEQALDGRDPANPFFGPMRSNRGLDLELAMRDVQPLGSPNGVVDGASLVQSTMDVRHLLTALSGGRPFRPIIVAAGSAGDLSIAQITLPSNSPPPAGVSVPAELRIDLDLALRHARQSMTSGTLTIPAAPDLLFRGFVEALMPYSSEVDGSGNNAWNDAIPAVHPLRTLNYGASPDLALRAAAHLTLNTLDAYDRVPAGGMVDLPTAKTLLMDSTFATQVGTVTSNGQLSFPWWDATVPTNNLNVDAVEGLPTGSPTTYLRKGQTPTGQPRALNVFGIEAQPFLTQVATMAMYTDAPNSNGGGGDVDWDSIIPPPGQPPNPHLITIAGQVHGVGDRHISGIGGPAYNSDFLGEMLIVELTNPFDRPLDISSYYVQFGGFYYKFANAAVIEAGVTKRYFVTCFSDYNTMHTRWTTITGAAGSPAPPPAIDDWIAAQIRTDPAETVVVADRLLTRGTLDATAGWIAAGTDDDLLDGVAGASTPDNQVVLLWQRLGAENELNRFLLADRLHDRPGASGPTLDCRIAELVSPGIDVTGTDGYAENTNNSPTGSDDNLLPAFQLSITTWGSLRRPDNPVQPAPIGAVPAYCIEVNPLNPGVTTQNQVAGTAGLGRSGLARTDIVAWGDLSLTAMLQNQAQARPVLTVPTMTPPNELLMAASLRSQSVLGPNRDAVTTYDKLYPEIPLFDNAAVFVAPPPLRVGDLLQIPAIGPEQDPTQASLDDQWLTLSESLAIALNYDSPAPPNASGTPQAFAVYHDAGGSTMPNAPRSLDRGCLVLDRFAPFEDLDSTHDGVFTNGMDRRRSPGIPLALNILNTFRAMDSRFGSLTKPTIGQININTAPLSVLRTLPMLSPSTIVVGGTPEWWWVGSDLDGRSDIAATFAAYRDKIPYSFRPTSSNAPYTGSVDFGNDNPNLRNPLGRSGATQITTATSLSGIREAPGFGSVGEILAARKLNAVAFNPAQPDLVYANPNNPDFLAHTGNVNALAGVSSTLYAGAGAPAPAAIPNGYAAQLHIANALLNCISVRSDLYAVWFLVHGYQRTDCEGLDDNQPMVPSVARRYLMVLDRSNVVKKGDKPRVIMLQELPIADPPR